MFSVPDELKVCFFYAERCKGNQKTPGEKQCGRFHISENTFLCGHHMGGICNNLRCSLRHPTNYVNALKEIGAPEQLIALYKETDTTSHAKSYTSSNNIIKRDLYYSRRDDCKDTRKYISIEKSKIYRVVSNPDKKNGDPPRRNDSERFCKSSEKRSGSVPTGNRQAYYMREDREKKIEYELREANQELEKLRKKYSTNESPSHTKTPDENLVEVTPELLESQVSCKIEDTLDST